MKLPFFQTVKSTVIISLFETVRLSVSISLRNLYNSLDSIKENVYSYVEADKLAHDTAAAAADQTS